MRKRQAIQEWSDWDESWPCYAEHDSDDTQCILCVRELDCTERTRLEKISKHTVVGVLAHPSNVK